MPYLDICPSFIIRKSLILPYGKLTGPEKDTGTQMGTDSWMGTG